MLVYTSAITSRLQYITDFLGKEITGKAFELTTDKENFLQAQGAKINYSASRVSTGECWIQPHGLLSQTGIQPQEINCVGSGGQTRFFATEGDYPFDLFAGCFYLLSRYEEYLPHQKDAYGRFAHQNSLAFNQQFLNQPLVNIWIQSFADELKKKFTGFTDKPAVFNFLPTYDIDIAWSFKHKGAWRNAGGLLRSFCKGEWKLVKQRIKVLRGKQTDPYDAFGWMNSLHERYRLKPYYFFLLAARTGRYDKNISPSSKALRALINDQQIRYPLGIHPSWRSGDKPSLLREEVETLAAITGSKVSASRQHYIRFNLPQGFRRLLDNGIRFDFSMGYGSINGFRASVASAFYWYDLEKEQATDLLLFPFCFMDANSFYEQQFTADQALGEMRHYYREVKSVGGIYAMIWHNSFLGTDPVFAGWREVYEEFIKELTT